MALEDQIQDDYITPGHPIAFSGISATRKHYHTKIPLVEKAFSSVYSYGLHREYKKPKIRNPFFVYSLREQVQMDLIDMQKHSEFNDNIRFILVAIDVFSKYVWIAAMKQKTSKDSLIAVKKVVQEIQADRQPKIKHVLLDRGKEFSNTLVYAYFRQHNINVIHPNSDVKAAVAERLNRSLKNIIFKYMTENETFRYIDKLDLLLQSYLSRPHSAIGFLTPIEAEQPTNHNKVLNAHYTRYSKIIKSQWKKEPKFKVGDIVRLKTASTAFDRGFKEQFTREYFTIESVKRRMPVIQYTVRSMDTDEVIEGSFYTEELQKIGSDDWRVSNVLKEKTVRGKKKLFVSWMGFSDRHNSWIDAENVSKQF